MTRDSKKIFYGFLFLCFLAVFTLGIGFLFFKDSDGGLSKVGDLFTGTEAIIVTNWGHFVNGDRAYGFADFYNRNNFAAESVSYRLKVFDKNNKLTEIIHGETSEVRPKEDKPIYDKDLRTPPFNINRVDVEITDTRWAREDVSIDSDLTAEIDEITRNPDGVVLKGLVKNSGAFLMSKVELVFYFRNEFGFLYFVTGTTMQNIGSFASQDFVFLVPMDDELLKIFDRYENIDVSVF